MLIHHFLVHLNRFKKLPILLHLVYWLYIWAYYTAIARATVRNVPRSAKLQVSFGEGSICSTSLLHGVWFFTAAFRAQQGEVMRMACRLDPRTGFQMAGEWLKYQLTAPVDTGPMNCKLPEKKIGIWDLFFNSSQEETALPFFFF